MFTIFLTLANLTLPSSTPYHNASTLISLIYAGLYILMEPVAGSLLAPLVIASSLAGTYSLQRWGAAANHWALGVQAVSWAAQFVGHGVYEGRRPALVDNLVQALFLAPLFVWIEVLFVVVGYRPELRARLEVRVKEARERLAAGKVGGKKE